LRPEATRIGFVAGGTNPNLDAIVWFLRDVWPAVYRPGISLHVYGGVGDMLRWNSRPQQQPGELETTFPGITHFYESRSLDIGAQPGVVLHGFVPHLSQIYAYIDIAINPVRFGSGLKIKNMEALGCGIPLLTTSHGAGGLEAHVGQALLVADEPAGFAMQLDQLLDSYALRWSLGTAAYQLVRTRFSPEACFGGLLAAIHALTHSPHTSPPQCSGNY
jgi:glycosyltransferase involved in cell wall biosynthesis